MGLLERHGDVRACVIPDTNRETLHGEVRRHVDSGSAVYTDDFSSYYGLDRDYAHAVINHTEAYVNEQVHTNGIENFWSCLKRTLSGTYISVQPDHLSRYVDEQIYRYNNRKVDDVDRFLGTLHNAKGRRLTYRALIGVPDPIPQG